MVNTIHERIEDHSRKLLRIHPASETAFNWTMQIRNSRALEWTWISELLHPNSIPDWIHFSYLDPETPCKWDLQTWEIFRQKEWARKFWTGFMFPRDQGTIRYYQGKLDPNLPDRFESKALFRQLLASIPPEIFELGKMLLRLTPEIMDSPSIFLHDDFSVFINPVQIQFLIADSRARYWRGRKGQLNLSQISIPEWGRDPGSIQLESEPISSQYNSIFSTPIGHFLSISEMDAIFKKDIEAAIELMDTMYEKAQAREEREFLEGMAKFKSETEDPYTEIPNN